MTPPSPPPRLALAGGSGDRSWRCPRAPAALRRVGPGGWAGGSGTGRSEARGRGGESPLSSSCPEEPGLSTIETHSLCSPGPVRCGLPATPAPTLGAVLVPRSHGTVAAPGSLRWRRAQGWAAELCTRAVQRNLTPRPCAGARFTPEPSAGSWQWAPRRAPCGAALRGRSAPEQPGEIPHLRVSPGAGKQKSRELKNKRQRPNRTVQARPGRTARSPPAPTPPHGAPRGFSPAGKRSLPEDGREPSEEASSVCGERRGAGPGPLGGAGPNSLGQERIRFPSGRCQRTAVPNMPGFPRIPRGAGTRPTPTTRVFST